MNGNLLGFVFKNLPHHTQTQSLRPTSSALNDKTTETTAENNKEQERKSSHKPVHVLQINSCTSITAPLHQNRKKHLLKAEFRTEALDFDKVFALPQIALESVGTHGGEVGLEVLNDVTKVVVAVVEAVVISKILSAGTCGGAIFCNDCRL